MTPQELRNSVLQLAIQGKLVEQRIEEGTADELYAQIRTEKQTLIETGKIKKRKSLPEIKEDELPFEIPKSWKWTRLDDLVIKEIKRGKSPTYASKSGTLVFAQKCNTKMGGINLNLAQYLDESKLDDYPESEFMRDSDIIINCTGEGTLGRVGIFRAADNPNSVPIVSDSHVTIIRTRSDLARYVFYGLKYYQPYMEKQGSGSTKQTELSASVIKSLLFPLPPLAEQQRIVAMIEELMPLVEEYGKEERRLTSLNAEFPDKLRKSILQQAIQGKLTERDSDDEPVSELLKQIRTEIEELVKAKKIKKPKKLPEISEDEIPFDIPEEWKWVRLGDITLGVADGPHFSPPYYDEGIPFISTRNVAGGKLDFSTAKFISPELHEELSKRCKPKKWDVLYTKGGTTGIAAVNDSDVEFNVWVHVAVLSMGSYVNPYYLAIALNSPHCYALSQEYTHGTSNRDLGLTRMVKITLPLPPFAEQQRIVDRVNDLLAMCDELN